jgi:V/A-type H+-transporting ATPase subunit D
MSSESPTRSRLIALGDERRAMREGYAFLDEKCLLLAAEMLAELQRHAALKAACDSARHAAQRCLAACLQRHGLDGLSVYPALPEGGIEVDISRSSLLGVALRRVTLRTDSATPAAKAKPAVFPSPRGRSLPQRLQRTCSGGRAPIGGRRQSAASASRVPAHRPSRLRNS